MLADIQKVFSKKEDMKTHTGMGKTQNMQKLPIMTTREKLFSIKDFEVQTFRSGGPGGQNQNKRNTGVRIIHKSSGAKEESR